MKKILYTIMALAISAFALQSCEDVPEPYTIPGQETGGGDTPIETIDPAGSGTAEDPYNVAAALQIITALSSDVQTEPMYVKGKICSIKEVETAQYGNANYYISDDGTSNNKLYIFQSYYLGNVKFTSEDQIKEGDEVVIYGRFVNYQGNTPETVGKGTSYIYSLNGNTTGGEKPSTGEAKGDGTLENPFNSVAANAYASSLAAGATSDIVYVKGKIASIRENFTKQYGNASFYISDDGTSTDKFYVFRTLYLNNERYTEGDILSVGDEVVICGKLTNYMGNTPETAQGASYLYSWTKGEGGDVPTEAGFDFSKQGYSNAQSVDGRPIQYDESTTMTFSKADGVTAPAYYNTGSALRMYGSNTLTISSTKKIKTVTVTFASGTDTSNRPYYATADNSSFNPATVTFNDNVANWTIGTNTAVLTYITKGGHFRIKTINIEYAE